MTKGFRAVLRRGVNYEGLPGQERGAVYWAVIDVGDV